MNSESIQKFKARLEAERDSLLGSRAHHEQNIRDARTGKDSAGPDHASEIINAGVEINIVGNEDQLLQKITHALERIQDGTYGVCESCGNDIPKARLEVKPSVSLCVQCQEAKEAGEIG